MEAVQFAILFRAGRPRFAAVEESGDCVGHCVWFVDCHLGAIGSQTRVVWRPRVVAALPMRLISASRARL